MLSATLCSVVSHGVNDFTISPLHYRFVGVFAGLTLTNNVYKAPDKIQPLGKIGKTLPKVLGSKYGITTTKQSNAWGWVAATNAVLRIRFFLSFSFHLLVCGN
jgi:hypothetical protein